MRDDQERILDSIEAIDRIFRDEIPEKNLIVLRSVFGSGAPSFIKTFEVNLPVVPEKHLDISPDGPAIDAFRVRGLQLFNKLNRIGRYREAGLPGLIYNKDDCFEQIRSFFYRAEEAGIQAIENFQGPFGEPDIFLCS